MSPAADRRRFATGLRRVARGTDAAREIDGFIAEILPAVRERVELRYGCAVSDRAAIDLLLRAVVIEMANLWFSAVETRIAMRRIMFWIRSQPRA